MSPAPARPAAGAPRDASPLEPKIVLEFLGAAAGIAAFMTLVGGAMLWLRFDELGLAADRAVAVLPNELLLTMGAQALAVPALVGLGAVIAIYALEPWAAVVLRVLAFAVVFVGVLVVEHILVDDLSPGAELILPVVAAVAVAALATLVVHHLCNWLVQTEDRAIALTFAVVGLAGVGLAAWNLGLPVLPHLVIVVLVTLAGAAAVLATTNKALGRRPVLWIVFLSFLLVGGAVALARTAAAPKMEPVALLLKDPVEQTTGFYVGEADGRIHIAELRHGSGLQEVSAEPVEAIVSLSRDRVTRMALRSPAGLGLGDEGREQAETLLEDLILEQRRSTGAPPPLAEPVATEDPVPTFAPLVSIHSEETVAPTSVDYFLQNSRLYWSFRDCPAKALTGKLATRGDWGILGGAGIRQAARCDGTGQRYRTGQYTRPHGKGRHGLEGREGFYLDLDNSKRKPEVRSINGSQRVLSNVPVYYECHPEENPEQDDLCRRADDPRARDERITYWFFYPYSIPPNGVREISHEGDWERVSVLVRPTKEGAWRPLSVRYHEHDSSVDVPWADVRTAPNEHGVGTHPRAYVAKGSHATYRRAGSFVQILSAGRFQIVRVKDDARACPKCPLWFTWNKLVDARREPWYGFGGAWGQVGSKAGFTGPLGPSSFKTRGLPDAPATTLQQASEDVEAALHPTGQ